MVSSPEIFSIFGTVVALLFSGNIYFIKRLVDRLEKTANAHEKTTAEVSQLTQNMMGLANQMRDIKADIKEFRRIEIEVAVLRAQFNPAKPENLAKT